MPILFLLLGGMAVALFSGSVTGKKKPDGRTFTLDANMPRDLVGQVLAALVHENDPAKLEAFAAALAAQFPISAQQLAEKAAAVRAALGLSTPQMAQPGSAGPVPPRPPTPAPSPHVAPPPPAAPAPAPAAPHAAPALPAFPPASPAALDIGNVPEPTRTRVLQLLLLGTSPAELEALAAELEARFPGAAASLRLKAAALRAAQGMTPPPVQPSAAPAAPPPPLVTPVSYEPEAPPPVVPSPPVVPADVTPAPAAPPVAPPPVAPPQAEVTPAPPVAPPPVAPVPPPQIPPSLSPQGAPAGTYRVLKGDFPYKIAGKLTGNPNRWPELIKANPHKKTTKDGNFTSLQPGEILNLPASWVQARPSQPAPPPAPAPPAVNPAPGLPGIPAAALDANIPPDVAQAVMTAMTTETDPAKLRGFAAALEGRYPKAALLLFAKAAALAPAVPVDPKAPPIGPYVPSMPGPPTNPFPGVPGLPAAALDANLPPDVVQAVMTALTTENDPAKLRGFAAALEGRYPKAAVLLRAKATALATGSGRAPGAPIFTVAPGGAPSSPPSLPIGGEGMRTGRNATRPRGYAFVVVRPTDKGLYPAKLAEVATGYPARHKEMAALNPHLAPGGKWKNIAAGDAINVPAEWVAKLTRSFLVQQDPASPNAPLQGGAYV